MNLVLTLDWSPSGDRLVTAGEDTTVRVWDVSPQAQILAGHAGPVVSVAWSPSGDRLATVSPYDTVRIWDVSTGEELAAIIGQGWVEWIIWSPSGDRVAGRTEPYFVQDPAIYVWDASTGEELLAVEAGFGRPSWSPTEDRLVAAASDGTVKIWDASTGEELLSFEGHDGDAGVSADWSPDGERIVTNDNGGQALVWDADNGEVLLRLQPEPAGGLMTRAVWSPDGQRIATHSEDTVGGRIWDVSTALNTGAMTGELLVTLTGHTGAVWSIDWSAEGERLLTGSMDGTAMMWDAQSGAELLRYSFSGQVNDSWSPDKEQIAFGLPDGTIRIVEVNWHTREELIAHARECCLIRQLTADERELFGLPAR
jgi:WD40 repeat protein